MDDAGSTLLLATSSPVVLALAAPRPTKGAPKPAKVRRARFLAADRKRQEDATGRVIADLRQQLAASEGERKALKEKLALVTVEHHSLVHSLEKAAKDADDDRRIATARLNNTVAAHAVDSASQAARAEKLRELAVSRVEAQAKADRAQFEVTCQRLSADVARLRAHRNRLLADATRFNKERNDLRAEVCQLRAEKSAATVRAAARLTFPGHRD